MNSCVLMAQVISTPELRSTQDNTSVSSMMVEFPSSREGEDPGKVQVEGWGNLAEEMKNSYNVGDKIVIEGRLSMNLYDMPEGYKEKRAKLVASRIYPVGVGSSNADVSNSSASSFSSDSGYPSPTSEPNNVVDFASSMQSQPASANASTTTATPEPAPPQADSNEDWDEIPF